MMHSVRTEISVWQTQNFKSFLESRNLSKIHVGKYRLYYDNMSCYDDKICYAYSDRDEYLTSNLIIILLIYGNLSEAYLMSIKGN